MRRLFGLAAAAALFLFSANASAQTSVTFDFEDGTDQGFGNPFSNDASFAFPNVTIGGSKRIEVLRDGGFQEADRHNIGADAFLTVMNLAVGAPAAYVISYDWYVDTSLSPGNYGTFLQLGTYINSDSASPNYVQDFPGSGKDVELNGGQLASGSVFSGTVSETVAAKYGALPANLLPPQTGFRLGFIVNGDGTQAKVYFDNVRIAPAIVAEPAALALAALVVPALGLARRRRK